MCPVSFALGRWRGEYGRPRTIALAPSICPVSYGEGFAEGERVRAERRQGSRR